MEESEKAGSCMFLFRADQAHEKEIPEKEDIKDDIFNLTIRIKANNVGLFPLPRMEKNPGTIFKLSCIETP